MSKTHKITIKNDPLPFIKLIKEGKKTVEGRVNSKSFTDLKVKDLIELYNHNDKVICSIEYLHCYKSFEEMIINEGLDKLLPGIDSIEKGIEIYKNFPGSNRAEKFGVLAIGLKPIK